MEQGNVARVRRLLAEAVLPEPEKARRRQGPLGTIRRKHLIQQARLLAGRYSLWEHLHAFVYAAGCSAITGLDLDQLEQLVEQLNIMGARLDVACDPPGAPPAR